MFMLEKRKNYQRPQQSFNEKLQLVRSQETQKRKEMHSLNLSRT